MTKKEKKAGVGFCAIAWAVSTFIFCFMAGDDGATTRVAMASVCAGIFGMACGVFGMLDDEDK